MTRGFLQAIDSTLELQGQLADICDRGGSATVAFSFQDCSDLVLRVRRVGRCHA